jgi:Endonuclease-reverse transcriptase
VATHSLLNTNSDTDIILIQEPWYGKIGTACSNTNPEGVEVLGGVANPMWDCLYPKVMWDEHCKVMAYRRISSSHFNITNKFNLASNHHLMMLDVHLGSSSFCILNIYHDTDHPHSLRNITDLDLDPVIPTIVGGDFNMHAHAWFPAGIRPSPWALELEEWALSQSLSLVNQPGVPTRCGEGCQQDTTLDLVWTNAAASLDEAFHELNVDFAASLGSDHAGLRIKYQHAMDTAVEQGPNLTSYLIGDEAKEHWIHYFSIHACYTPFNLSSPALIDQETDRLSQDIEETCQTVFEQCKAYFL